MKQLIIFTLLLSTCYSAIGDSLSDTLHHKEAYRSTTGVVYKITIKNSSFRFDHADYSIFIPDSISYIKGIFIHQHGCGMEGIGAATAYDIQYEAFARKWHLAIICPDLYPTKDSGCLEWISPEDGSGPALLAAIDSFSNLSGHPELNNVPWLLWGHSGGGYWVLKMMTEYPNRILAAFCYSAAFDPDLNFPAATAKIPIMLRHAGKNDCRECWQTATHTFIKLRHMNSYASLSHTQGQTHNFSFVRYMAIPFFKSVLSQRLPDSGSSVLRNMDITKAWLGDTLTHKVYKLSSYKGSHKKKTGMSLLPDSVTAVKWKEYVTTGTVIDRSPPPPPYDIKISKSRTSNTYLAWKVRGDIESPIKYFNIYKNNRIIGRFPKSTDYQTFNTNGDNAIPIIPPKTRFGVTVPIRESDTLAITEVNQFNLESTKAKIIIPKSIN